MGVAAILKYPTSKNRKHLRQFLATTNFHCTFMIKYEDFVAPLLPLIKRKWTAELQLAFET
jgi:hypothetical protein